MSARNEEVMRIVDALSVETSDEQRRRLENGLIDAALAAGRPVAGSKRPVFSGMITGRALDEREVRFVDECLVTPVPREAAELAGYPPGECRTIGEKLAADPDIRAELELRRIIRKRAHAGSARSVR